MRSEGVGDTDIIGNLQQKGISPREINDALSQEKIKSAVAGNETREMEPSVMGQTAPAPSPQESYSPRTQEISEQEMYPPSQDYSQQEMYPPNQDYSQQEMYPPSQDYSQQAQQEFYPEEDSGYQSAGMDTSTIIEIAEQVFSEKMKKILKQIDEMNEFKTLAQMKIESSVERLKRIESTIDKLQASILEKVGSYGQNLESIKKEMSMMQDSFGKMINPLAERAERHIAHKSPLHNKTSISQRKKNSKKR
ncbi:MAG TPA: hypothetical protein VMZ91_15580 [Candidatus Paceibacterota bacterium]|nr:hypothetical protein [Candidatus Paceibacterota bacterium]